MMSNIDFFASLKICCIIVEYAYFDDDMWTLLQHKEWTKRLRDYIVEHKLTDNRWKGLIAAEGLGTIAALLLVA